MELLSRRSIFWTSRPAQNFLQSDLFRRRRGGRQGARPLLLHPNNEGRCGHICNASYAVERTARGLHLGEALVSDCLAQGKAHGFGILQFNAVVATNVHARHLYERLGFTQLGTIPKGFRMKDRHFEDICPYYHEL